MATRQQTARKKRVPGAIVRTGMKSNIAKSALGTVGHFTPLMCVAIFIGVSIAVLGLCLGGWMKATAPSFKQMSLTEKETATWQTYTEDGYPISFRYPPDIKFTQNLTSIPDNELGGILMQRETESTRSTDDNYVDKGFTMSITIRGETMEYADHRESSRFRSKNMLGFYEDSTDRYVTKVNGNDIYVYSPKDSGGDNIREVTLPHGDFTYTFYFGQGPPGDRLEMFYKLLSSVKFS